MVDMQSLLKVFSENNIMVRLCNLKVAGLDRYNKAYYVPEARVVIGKDGYETALFIGDDLGVELQRAYNWCIDNNLIK